MEVACGQLAGAASSRYTIRMSLGHDHQLQPEGKEDMYPTPTSSHILNPLGCQWIGMPGMGSRLRPTDLHNGPTNRSVVSTPLPIKLPSLASPGLKPKGGVKSGRSGAYKPGKHGLSSKADKNSDPGIEELGVLPTMPW